MTWSILAGRCCAGAVAFLCLVIGWGLVREIPLQPRERRLEHGGIGVVFFLAFVGFALFALFGGRP